MTTNKNINPIKFTLLDLDSGEKYSEYNSIDEMIKKIKEYYKRELKTS